MLYISYVYLLYDFVSRQLSDEYFVMLLNQQSELLPLAEIENEYLI